MFQWRLKAEISIKQFYNNDQLNGVLGIWGWGRSVVSPNKTKELIINFNENSKFLSFGHSFLHVPSPASFL